MSIISALCTRLVSRKKKSLYRQRHVITKEKALVANINGKVATNFCSNDYLGLSQHPSLISALKEGIDRYGTGGTASAIVSGHLAIHRKAEEAFAEFVGCEAAIMFSNGFMANQGIINTLAQKDNLIFADKLVHASIIDACKLSSAKLIRYPHLKYEMLTAGLIKHCNTPSLIVTDSIFSMRGDMADLPQCVALSEQFNAALIIDDAHGIGVLGENGAGCVEYFNIPRQKITALVCPLAKAFGIMGAMVLGSREVIEGIIQFARSYIYTTAIPPAYAYAAMRALLLVKKEKWRRDKLNANILYFRSLAATLGVRVLFSTTPIQIIHIGKAEQAQLLSKILLAHGFLLNAMRPPTVPAGESNLRVTLSSLHDENDINALLQCISEAQYALS